MRSKKKSKASYRRGEPSASSFRPTLTTSAISIKLQTPDAALAHASFLDNSKILKKTTGATGNITNYETRFVEKLLRNMSLFGNLHTKVKRFDQNSQQ